MANLLLVVFNVMILRELGEGLMPLGVVSIAQYMTSQ